MTSTIRGVRNLVKSITRDTRKHHEDRNAPREMTTTTILENASIKAMVTRRQVPIVRTIRDFSREHHRRLRVEDPVAH
jgi:hypothetical protein